MLSRGAPHAHTALHNAVDLAGPFVFSALFIIVLHIAKSGLVRQRADRPGAEGLAISKNNLRIFVRLTLVFARKIQVYIGLFVSFKAKKCLERNVKTVLNELLPADWTELVRHIAACHSSKLLDLLRIKITVVAVFAIIVRAERIHLRDSRHRRHKGRTDRPARAHQITVLHRLPHKLLRNDIHHGKSVADNRVQLAFEPCLHNVRKLVTIHFVRFPVADLRELLVTVLNDRRAFIRSNWRDSVTHICNHVRVGDDNLLRFLAAQIIRKLVQHLLRRAKE